MHIDNSLFSHFQHQQPIQQDLICLVLTDFLPYSDLNHVKKLIQSDFTFISCIKVINNREVQCYFTSMGDLIDLDQGKAYGAGRAYIRDSSQRQMNNMKLNNSMGNNAVFQNSQLQNEPYKDCYAQSYKMIPQLEQDQNQQQYLLCNPKLLHRPTMQRLTSLEDEIVEIQKIREELNLFKDEIEHDMTFETDQMNEYDPIYTCEYKKYSQHKTQDTQSQVNFNHEQQLLEISSSNEWSINKKEIVLNVLQGALLAGILYGGFKFVNNLLR